MLLVRVAQWGRTETVKPILQCPENGIQSMVHKGETAESLAQGHLDIFCVLEKRRRVLLS